MGNFEVTKVCIHDDLLQEGLKKKPAKSAASFVTIGEPDIDLNIKGKEATVEIKGLDIYDPIKDEVKPRNVIKIEIDDEAFDRLYGHISHPIEIKKKGQKIAVRIISQFREECTKVLNA